jgi:1,3-beta-glucanosyltransferase GAS5
MKMKQEAFESRKRNNANRYGIPWCSLVVLVHLALLLLLGADYVQASNCTAFAPPAILKGRKLFDSVSGTYIPIKGINYYPRPNAGNLTETNSVDFYTEDYRFIWERDLVYLKMLNINVIRIYAVAPGQNHDGFLCALRAAGMYLIVGLGADCLDCAIKNTTAPDCYPASLKTRGQFIISEFARYDNVLAFSAANEANLAGTPSASNGPCQKQFVRDMRAFIQNCSNTIRHIPVGVELADGSREENALWYK